MVSTSVPHAGKPKRPAYVRKDDNFDTIIVPTRNDTFEQVFLKGRCWYPVRLSKDMLGKVKWVAAYRSAPVSAITHIAKVSLVENCGQPGKYKLSFSKTPIQIKPVPFANARRCTMRGPRYTTKALLQEAAKLTDLFEDQSN